MVLSDRDFDLVFSNAAQSLDDALDYVNSKYSEKIDYEFRYLLTSALIIAISTGVAAENITNEIKSIRSDLERISAGNK